MKENEVRQRAFAMPLTSPAYPIGPYRFINREYLVITYRTDPKKLRELVPDAKSRASTSATLRPRVAASRAEPTPTMPPPFSSPATQI